MMTKDQTVRTCVERHASELGGNRFRVVDHWDADLYAVGLAAIEDPRRLVYVSTFGQVAGRYAFECEEPEEGREYRTVARGDAATFEELREIVRAHLALGPR